MTEGEPTDNDDPRGQQPAAGYSRPFFQRVRNHGKPSSPNKDVIQGWVRTTAGQLSFTAPKHMRDPCYLYAAARPRSAVPNPISLRRI